MTYYGGIEAGGTKFVCAVGTGPGDLRAETRFPTTSPAETINRALSFFRPHMTGGELALEKPPDNPPDKPRGQARGQAHGLAAVGIASFGPVDPDPGSPRFGCITTTPKPGWANTDLAGPIRRALGVPVGFDTDVNGAALGERCWGAGRGLDTFIYLTVGTGLGGGGVVHGEPLHGLIHPEMGHIRVPHDWQADPFPGTCPFHGDCLEGLAAGPALEARWGQPAETLPPEHPAWALEARYLALGLVNFITILSPQRIIMGGGIMQQPQMFPLIRREVQILLNGYVQAPEILDRIEEYIVPPELGSQAGVLGAIALAQDAAKASGEPGSDFTGDSQGDRQ